MFTEVEPSFLKGIATDSDRIPTLYYSKNFFVRTFFWFRLRLIYWALKRHQKAWGTGLDFGGGGGVFLPTLSSLFQSVDCADLETSESQKVVARYALPNVTLNQGDIANMQLEKAPYDAIVAADVLEHFQDLRVPARALFGWLKPSGYLYVSLPSENFLYILLRKVFGIVKPFDHYHAAYQVEDFLSKHGFQRVAAYYCPLYLKLFPLFHITVWRKNP